MYSDDVAPSLFQRMLNASWPLFRAFGVDVRVHWTILIVPVALFAMYRTAGFDNEAAASLAAASTFGMYFSVWVHEMGHVLTARRFGVPSRLITLSPVGGLAHLEADMPNPRAEIWVALGGPLAQAALGLVSAVPYFALRLHEPAAFPEEEMWRELYRWFLVWQAGIIAFNLLPCYPLDGGRVFRGFLAQRMHPNRASLHAAYAGSAGAIVMFLAGVGVLFGLGEEQFGRMAGTVLVIIGFNNFIACRALMTEAQHGESAYDASESWKRGGGAPADDTWRSSLEESERLTREEARRERRLAEARLTEESERRRVQERVDELLDRINEVGGVSKLSAAERRELAEASELLRRETAGN